MEDNIKQVVKDIRCLIATNCSNETVQKRIENFINERDEALRTHDVVEQSEQLLTTQATEKEIEKAIRTTLVVLNKQSILISVKKIMDVINKSKQILK